MAHHPRMFEGFEEIDIETPRGSVRARVGGSGPPLLLMHGWPETHLMWHPVAPALAERFTVVAPDLPGYGDSFRPPVSEDHGAHSKRALAADLVAALGELGHRSFAVAGHDRGGRVAYRMALDHPEAVTALGRARHRPHRRGLGAGGRDADARLLALGVPRPARAAARAADLRATRTRSGSPPSGSGSSPGTRATPTRSSPRTAPSWTIRRS